LFGLPDVAGVVELLSDKVTAPSPEVTVFCEWIGHFIDRIWV
jgi:hypothetical protein